MTKDGNVPRPQSSFSTSGLTLCTTILRLAVLFELLPEELSYFLRLPAVESTVARRRETLPFLQVASSFRHFSPTLSQAYLASSSPPPILVWSAYLTLESWWTLLPEYWRRVVWGLGLLLVDYAIARILERIAKSCLEESKENMNEEELQLKMPTVIQPPRAHLFEISSIEKQTDDDMASPLLRTADIPILAANLYYASPITLFASGMYGCFQNVWLGLLLWSIYEMVFVGGRNNSNVTLAAVSLALASYGQPWNSVFVVPICVSQPCKKTAAIFVTMFSLFVLWLQMLEFLLVGSEAYWTWKPLTSLSPNLGPLWYFQMQLFDRFQDYFRIMFIGMPYLVVIPLAIRLYRYPIVLITSLWFIGTLFQHNPTLYDLNVALCLLVMSPRSMARMNVASLIAICSIAVPVILYVLDYGLWLETGSGNANYIYFQCLAYNGFGAIMFLDFLGASLQRDKALRVTEKLEQQSKTRKHDIKT